MGMPEGKRMVLVVKRERSGQWFKKNGGMVYGWTLMSYEEAVLYERAASKAGDLERFN
jgi:hypothetical protein